MVRDLLQLNNFQKRVMLGLLISVFACAVLYIVLVHRTVDHIVERRALETRIAERGASVSSLEIEYMKVTKTITINEARSRGFGEVRPDFFVSRSPAALTFLPVE